MKSDSIQEIAQTTRQAQNPIVVISHGSGVNALAIVRSLGRLGVTAYVIAKQGTNNLAARSRYAAKTLWISDETAVCLVNALEQILAGVGQQPVLFCDSDEALSLAATCTEWLATRFIVPYSLDSFEKLQNKEYQSQKAIAAGINVPQSWYVNTWKDILAIKRVGGKRRLLAKPNPNRFRLTAPFKVLWADDSRSLCEQLRRHVVTPEGMVVQEFIDGDDECMWVVSGYRGISGNCDVLLTMVKTKQSGSGAGGVGIIVQTRDNPDLRDMAARFMNETEYTGPFAMEFKFSQDDSRYYFIENNFRTARIHVIGRRMRADLPRIVYADVTECPCLLEEDRRIPITMWYYDITGCLRTLPLTRDRRVFWGMVINLLAAPFRRKEWAVHAWDDFGPTILSISIISREMLRRIAGKLVCLVSRPGIGRKAKSFVAD